MEWGKTPSLSLKHKSHFFNFLENGTILWKNGTIAETAKHIYHFFFPKNLIFHKLFFSNIHLFPNSHLFIFK